MLEKGFVERLFLEHIINMGLFGFQHYLECLLLKLCWMHTQHPENLKTTSCNLKMGSMTLESVGSHKALIVLTAPARTCPWDPCRWVHVPARLCSQRMCSASNNMQIWKFDISIALRETNSTIEGGIYFLLKMRWKRSRHTLNTCVHARGTVSHLKQVKELNSIQLIVSLMSLCSYSFIHQFYSAAPDVKLLEMNRRDRSLSLRWTCDPLRKALHVSNSILEPCCFLGLASLVHGCWRNSHLGSIGFSWQLYLFIWRSPKHMVK